MGQIVPPLFICMDGFGIKWLTKVDMPLNKKIKPNQKYGHELTICAKL